jgi:hypothetical protein
MAVTSLKHLIVGTDKSEPRLTIGEPVWKRLDRGSVEALVGEEV